MNLKQVISKDYQIHLEDAMTSLAFPWFYNKWVDKYDTTLCGDENVVDSFQFSHVFYDNGVALPTYNLVQPLLEAIANKANISHYNIVRVKANLTTNHNFPSDSYQIPHVDTSPPSRTFIYYVNDSDGDTVLFNERVGDKFDKFTIKEESSPIRGNVFGFDGSHYHAGRFPALNPNRIVINFVIR